MYFLFQWYYFKIQQPYSQWQESKYLDIKLVTVKKVRKFIQYSISIIVREFTAMSSSSFNPHHSFLYIRPSEPEGRIGLRKFSPLPERQRRSSFISCRISDILN